MYDTKYEVFLDDSQICRGVSVKASVLLNTCEAYLVNNKICIDAVSLEVTWCLEPSP